MQTINNQLENMLQMKPADDFSAFAALQRRPRRHEILNDDLDMVMKPYGDSSSCRRRIRMIKQSSYESDEDFDEE